jgi:predicted membrane channel-forming protein YqfA (hemolysin III family)
MMTLPQPSYMAPTILAYIMDFIANRATRLVTCHLLLWPASVRDRDQVSITPIAIVIHTPPAASGYILLDPEYAKPIHRIARTSVFVGLALSAVIPLSHLFLYHGIYTFTLELGFHWLLAACIMYITGTTV